MKGPIKAAVVGVIIEVGGVAKDILVFSLSEDLDLLCTRGWGGGGAAKAGKKGGWWGGAVGWCLQLHWGCSDESLFALWWWAGPLPPFWPLPPPWRRNCLIDSTRPIFLESSALGSELGAEAPVPASPRRESEGPTLGNPPLVLVRDRERPLLWVMSCP